MEQQGAGLGASRVVRRVHMYLGLFLVPWMLMYALSTLVMNHHELVSSWYRTKSPVLNTERELAYSRTFAPGTAREEVARDILRDVGLDGTFRVSGGRDGKPLVIDRLQPLAQRRISFDPSQGKITIQREEFRGSAFLERLHRRRGYQHPYAWEDTWAFSVDLAVTAMVFWSLSGLWLWWELRSTRPLGALCAGLGLLSFALFLAWL